MPQDTIDPQRAAQLRKEADEFCKEFLPDPTTPCNMDHVNDALNYKCPELPAATRMAACNEAHVNEVKTLELEPRLIGMDLAKGDAVTVLAERRPDGKMIIYEPGQVAEQDLRELLKHDSIVELRQLGTDASELEQLAKAGKAIANGFETAEKAAQVFQQELEGIEAVKLSADLPTVSKYRHGKQIPARQYEKAKKRRAMQAQSRKRNRR